MFQSSWQTDAAVNAGRMSQALIILSLSKNGLW